MPGGFPLQEREAAEVARDALEDDNPRKDLKVTKTPEGIVVRIIRASGECAYRKNFDGSWVMTCDHKGPWVSINAIDVPATALRVVAKMAEGRRNRNA